MGPSTRHTAPKSRVLSLLSALLLVCYTAAESISDFEGGYFKIMKLDQGIYPLDVGISQADDGTITAAYGDFNDDS